MCADGALFSIMVGAGETYLPAFALAIGLGDVVAGLVSGVPLLAGAVVQLVTPFAVRRLGSHRRWVVGCATFQALTFVPLVWMAATAHVSTTLLFSLATLYWATGMATGPAWNTWAETLVPKRISAQFFARRARLSQVCLLIGLLAAGAALQAGRDSERLFDAFAIVFFVAGVARLLSARCLAAHSEPVRLPDDYRIVSPRSLFTRREGGGYGWLLVFMLALQASVHIAAPFFTPYMLGRLALSYDRYVVLIAAALVAKAVASPFVAEAAERLGSARVLRISALAIVPLPALWLLSDDFTYLVGLQILSGLAWASYELITMLLFFETIRPSERTSVLTLFNLANAGAIVGGTLMGGAMLAQLGGSRDAYFALFTLSAVARACASVLAWKVRLPEFHASPFATRTVAVRPGGSSIERPVLPSIPPAERA